MLKQYFIPMYSKKVYFGPTKELDLRKLKYLIKLLVHAALSRHIFDEVSEILKLDKYAKKMETTIEDMIEIMIKKEKESRQIFVPIKFMFENKTVIEKCYGWDYNNVPKEKFQMIYPVIAENIDKIMEQKQLERGINIVNDDYE